MAFSSSCWRGYRDAHSVRQSDLLPHADISPIAPSPPPTPPIPAATALSSSSSQSQSAEERLKVYLRIRPLPAPERERCGKPAGRPNPKAKEQQARKPSRPAGDGVCLVATAPNSVALTVPQSKLVDHKRGRTEVFDGFSTVLPPDSSQKSCPLGVSRIWRQRQWLPPPR